MPRDIRREMEGSFRSDDNSGETAEALDKIADAQKRATESSSRFEDALSKEVDTLDGVREKFKGGRKELENFDKTQKRASKTAGEFGDDIKEQASLLGLLRDKMSEGNDEAQRLTGGFEKNATASLAMGAALFYAANKVSELNQSVQDTAVGFASFRTEMSTTAAVMPVEEGSLDLLREFRSELSLTQEQFSGLSDTIQEAAYSGVVSIGELKDAAKAFQDTFGGDPSEKTKEYFELLKEIPTLETDLSITASMDDRAAAAFALAQGGKIPMVMEMGASGVFEGLSVDTEINKNDVDLLNASQKTAKFTEDISVLLHKWYGAWGPMTGQMAAGIVKTAGLAGSLIVMSGTMKSMLFAESVTAKNTSAMAGKEMVDMPQGTTGKALRGIKNLFKRGGQTKLAKTGLKTGGKILSKGKSLGNLAKGGAIVGTVATIGGMLTKKLGGHIEEAGHEITGNALELGGAMAEATGTIGGFVSVGSALGPVGTAIGATAGVALAAASNMDIVADASGELADELMATRDGQYKYNALIRSSARGFEDMSEKAQMISDYADASMILMGDSAEWWSDTIGGAAKSFKRSLVNTEEETKALSKADKERLELEKIDIELAEERQRTAVMEQREAKRRAESWKEYQKLSNELNSELENSKLKFMDFRKEVAGLQFKNLENVGGNSGGFNQALGNSLSAVGDRFSMLNDALSEQRKKTVQNMKLEASERRLMLMQINKAQLEASNDFAESILEVAGEFKKIPEIIINELQRGLRESTMDLGIEAGTFSMEEIAGTSLKNIESSFENFQKAQESLPDRFEALSGLEETAKKRNKKAKKEVEDMMSRLKGTEDEGIAMLANDVLIAKDRGIGIDDAIRDLDEAVKQRNKKSEARRKEMEASYGGSLDEIKSQIESLEEKRDDLSVMGDWKEKKKIAKEIKERQKAMNDLKAEQDSGYFQRGTLIESGRNTLGTSIDSETLFEKTKIDIQTGIIDFVKGIVDVTGKIGESLEQSAGIQAQERLLGILEAQVVTANSADVLIGKIAEKNEAVFKKQKETIDAYSLGLSTLDRVREMIQKTEPLNDDDIDKMIEQYPQYEDMLEGMKGGKNKEALIGIVKKEEEEIQGKMASAHQELTEMYRNTGSEAEEAASQIASVRIGEAIMGLADTRMELSGITGNLEDARDAYSDSVDASKENAEEQKRIIEETFRNKLDTLEKEKKAAEKAGRTERVEELEGDAGVLAAEKTAKLKEQDLKHTNNIIQSSERLRDLEMQRVDTQQGFLDERISYLQEIGGSYGEIFELQKQSIGWEKQKLEIARKNFERLREEEPDNTQKIEEARLDLVKQQYEVQKKMLGAQRDAFDKLLGMAFGAIRGERGARKGLTSESRFFGSNLVKSPGGTVMGKGAMTIQERSSAFQTTPSRGPGERAMGGAVGAGGLSGGRAGASESTGTVGADSSAGGRMPQGGGREQVSVSGKASVKIEFDEKMFKTKVVNIILNDPRIRDRIPMK